MGEIASRCFDNLFFYSDSIEGVYMCKCFSFADDSSDTESLESDGETVVYEKPDLGSFLDICWNYCFVSVLCIRSMFLRVNTDLQPPEIKKMLSQKSILSEENAGETICLLYIRNTPKLLDLHRAQLYSECLFCSVLRSRFQYEHGGN